MMMEIIWKGIALGLLLSIAVGPILFSIIKQSVNNGVKGGLAFVFGVSLSDISLVIASNFFTELFSDLHERRTEIAMLGSTFLISVGVYYLFFKKIKVNDQGLQLLSFRKRDYIKIFAAGYFMNTLNPAIIIFWLTTSTAFLVHSFNQKMLIFALALTFVLLADITKVILAGRLRKKLTIKTITMLNRINGIILIGFGIALMVGALLYKPEG